MVTHVQAGQIAVVVSVVQIHVLRLRAGVEGILELHIVKLAVILK